MKAYFVGRYKSRFIILTVFFFSSSCCVAQKFYVDLGTAINAGLEKSSFVSLEHNHASYYNLMRWDGYKSERYSLGQGFQPTAYAGYRLRSFFALEMGISYLFGGRYQFFDLHGIREWNNQIYPHMHSYLGYGRMLRLTPGIRLTIGKKKITGYGKVGFNTGLATRYTTIEKSVYQVEATPHGGTDNLERIKIWEYRGGLSYGVHGAVGLNIALAKKLGLYFELLADLQDWAMKRGKLVSDVMNGRQIAPFGTTASNEVVFEPPYGFMGSGPMHLGNVSIPFSALGINLGVHFDLGKE